MLKCHFEEGRRKIHPNLPKFGYRPFAQNAQGDILFFNIILVSVSLIGEKVKVKEGESRGIKAKQSNLIACSSRKMESWSQRTET